MAVFTLTGLDDATTLETTGGAVSILIVTDAEAERPASLVAEQVKLVPGVSANSAALPHPALLAIPDSESVTAQLRVTGTSLIQPEAPGIGLTPGTIIGGVV